MKRSPLRRESAQRARERRQYRLDRLNFLRSNPRCCACARLYKATNGVHGSIPPRPATDIHHMKGRAGDLYLDQRYWMEVCRECHEYAHTHPEMARSLGISLSRYDP